MSLREWRHDDLANAVEIAKFGSMKVPRQSRAARRAATSGTVRDLPGLRARIAAEKLRGDPSPVTERARKLLLVWLETAQAQGAGFADVVRKLNTGEAARQIAQVDLDAQLAQPEGSHTQAACRSGCAFCCILNGQDGALITEDEARRLHAALAPLAGAPDGRSWHPRACAALDPETRMCRAYDARPMICRTFISSDAAACEQNAGGTPAPGSGVLGAQGVYLAIHALARAALSGVARVPTLSLSSVAQGAVEGVDIETAVTAARHKPRALEDERKRMSGLG